MTVSRAPSVSYAAPAVSFVGSANVVTTIGWSVTVSGVSFGALDTTPSSRVGLSSCVTASWASATSVVCLPAGGQGVTHDAVLTSVAVAGTQTTVFSYDGAYLACCFCASVVLRKGACCVWSEGAVSSLHRATGCVLSGSQVSAALFLVVVRGYRMAVG